MATSKLLPIAIKSATSGILAGVAMRLFIGSAEGVVLPTMLGEYSIPIVIGGTVALSQVAGESIKEFALDPSSVAEWDDKLYGFLRPALASASTIGIIMFGWTGSPDGMANYIKLAAISAGAVMATDYTYTTFLEDMLTK